MLTDSSHISFHNRKTAKESDLFLRTSVIRLSYKEMVFLFPMAVFTGRIVKTSIRVGAGTQVAELGISVEWCTKLNWKEPSSVSHFTVRNRFLQTQGGKFQTSAERPCSFMRDVVLSLEISTTSCSRRVNCGSGTPGWLLLP